MIITRTDIILGGCLHLKLGGAGHPGGLADLEPESSSQSGFDLRVVSSK